MSAPLQVRRRTNELPQLGHQPADAPPGRDQDDPIELLRNVVARLREPGIGLPDKAQLAGLLAEAQEALERANAIARALVDSQRFIDVCQFDKALEALGETLLLYPGDAALTTRYSEIERQREAQQTAARVRTVVEEANWLLNQNRPDLAFQFLRDKTTEFPDDRDLKSRLNEVEALLPRWQEERNVRATLARAATLEQPQRWDAALAILEEALQIYPESEELLVAEQELRCRVSAHERQTKLERRLDRLAQLVDAKAWNQARTLLESTKAEFPGTLGLDVVQAEINDGIRRSECESLVSEVRQWLSDGELEEAERALTAGRKSLGPDPMLDALEREVDSDRVYREQLRAAQVCLGRRQFGEAERKLEGLAAQGRAEAIALLDAVRVARAASDEENFFERGREKAIVLMRDRQFGQAADLLSNLLSLFPDDPILMRDLSAARSALKLETQTVATPPERKESELEPTVAVVPEPLRVQGAPVGEDAKSQHSRFWNAAVAGGASIVLVSGMGGAWILAQNRKAPSKVPAISARVELNAGAPAPVVEVPPVFPPVPVASAAVPEPAPLPAQKPVAGSPTQGRDAKPRPSRIFVPPPERQVTRQSPADSLPLPPRTDRPADPTPRPELLAGIAEARMPMAPAPVNTVSVPATVPEKPKVAVTEVLIPPRLLTHTLPNYPDAARTLGFVGKVTLHAIIDKQGNVTNLKVLSGNPVLASAAKSAVVKWKYVPSTLNGQPVAAPISIVLVFGTQN